MANILLSWTSPANITNVDSIELFRIKKLAGDADVATAPACSDYVDSDNNPVSSADHLSASFTGSDVIVPSAASTAMSYVDTVSEIGEYYYAAFSKNAAGYSPCTTTTSRVSITTV
jgi:hypothetical protein